VTDGAGTDRLGWDRFDLAIAVIAAIATLFVHPISKLLHQPYWVDEAWVADLTRASWSRMVAVGSPTPVGFVALLKLVPGSGQQRGRLLVLGFSVLGVVAAYVFARTLQWNSRRFAQFAGIATAFVVMMAPVSLIRNDLKQYTCDAFCAIAILTLGAKSERDSDFPLAWLGGAAVAAALFSSTSAFVTVAMFGGLLISAVTRRQWQRAREIAIAGAITGVLLAAYFALVVNPKLSNGLHAYWAANYLHGTPLDVLHASWHRLRLLASDLAMPAIFFVLLFFAGVYELDRLRARAVAVAVPLLWIEMVIIGRLQKYPFLDLRTSQFLLVSSLLVVAIGAVGLVRLAGTRLHLVAGVAMAVVLAVSFTAGCRRFVDKTAISQEDARSQTEYVAAHRTSRDVILVNGSGNFGFAYYWPHGHVVLKRDNSGAGFRGRVAGVDAVYATDRTNAAVADALREALRRAHGPDGDGRIFIVRTHLNGDEVIAWRQAFVDLGVHPTKVGVGREALLVIDPALK
jgi:hypothetical protein